MKIIHNPVPSDWLKILRRPEIEKEELMMKIEKIFDKVARKGDDALHKYTKKYDGASIDTFAVGKEEIEHAASMVPDDLKKAIYTAIQNITAFHKSQLHEEARVETMPGVTCWRKSIPIDRVGIYIPGGTAPLFSTVIMLGIPAILAGCREIILCSPPSKEGTIAPAILYAAQQVGIIKMYKVGGAQAIAAMTFGTDSIPAVDKIFGPGNQYVNAAKQYATTFKVGIDMPAGPSEVAVIADENANPAFIAADLLSQAEHGSDSQVLLVTPFEELAIKVINQVEKQMERSPRKKYMEASIKNSFSIVLSTMFEAINLINAYAPEHLIIHCDNPHDVADKIKNAGSVFIGAYTPESAGDYASGTNHTLPTDGYARMYSGVSVDSFVKKVTFQEITREGLQQIGNVIVTMAQAEGLDAHAQAVLERLKD